MREDAMPSGPRPPRRPRLVGPATAAVAAVVAVIAALLAVGPASAQPAPNLITLLSTQRGPDPTIQSIEASRGTFATARQSVAPGNEY